MRSGEGQSAKMIAEWWMRKCYGYIDGQISERYAAYRGLKNRNKNTEVQNVNVFNPLLSSPLPTLV
jgi:hypothetical protein